NAFAFEENIVINEIMYNAPGLPADPGSPATYQSVTLTPYQATWRYNESGASLAAGWATTAHPVGGTWKSGPGILAAENDPTAVPVGTTLADPADNNPRVTTYYFETEFTLTALQLTGEIVINHLIDDGAVFYINGVEFERYGIQPGVIDSSVFANRGGESVITGPVTIPDNLLVAGSNRISVEVHQTSAGSSDVVMGLEIVGRQQLTPAVPGMPFRNSNEQWIELYNRGTESVDLGGWEFTDGVQFRFPAGSSLAPGHYLTVAADLPSFTSKYPAVPVAGEFNGNLSRSGERLRLVDTNKNPVDEVRFYDGGRWPDLADGGGSSLELRDPGADNNTPGAWAASDESADGQWQTFTYRGTASNHGNDPAAYHEFIFGLHNAGTLLIDDISVVENPDGTARQLVQNGGFESGDTDKWRFLGTHRHTEVIPDPDNPGNNVLRLQATGGTEHMSNHAETTFFNGGYVNTNSNQTYQISFRARWVAGSNQLNTRLYFNRLARTHTLPFAATHGTPGTANSAAGNNIGPTYKNLVHTPAVPDPGQPCTVSVTPLDPDGVAALQLRYAVDGGAFNNIAMVTQPSGRWSGTIPGQSGSAKVQFYIAAIDTRNAVSHIPAAGPESRALIPWQDGQANLDYGTCQPNNLRVVM
ncbi:MAG: lamin tail domain-containing protein, partial [Verrucomicrobiales bacterium]|nr:lamin tail domain-containing protein [Verrucomicrobiales bacterium]